MFFSLSKIFWALAQPLNALCLLAAVGLLLRLRWKHAGQRIMNTALLLIVVFGILPIGPFMVLWLERRHPIPETLPDKVDGIIVLGGAFDSALSMQTGQIVANDQIDRMLCFVDLANRYPKAKLMFSGGAGDIMNPTAMEADSARQFLSLTGLEKREILYEEKSRNTYENALYSKEMVTPQKGENWIVTTSAYHMPRTVGIFDKLGWNIIPYGCDPKSSGGKHIINRIPNVASNYAQLNIAVKEILGMLAYKITGKI